MKLHTYVAVDLLNSWANAHAVLKYSVFGNRYWAGRILVASVKEADPRGIRFMVAGYATATEEYWPNPEKISVRRIADFDASLVEAYHTNYRSLLNIFQKDTE